MNAVDVPVDVPTDAPVDVLRRLEWINWACPVCGASKFGSGLPGSGGVHRYGCALAIAIGAVMGPRKEAV